MKVLKKVKKEIEVVTEDHRTCDKCNQKIEERNYNVFECTLIHKTGQIYPEGGSGELQEMDLCGKCAPLLIELLRANGYRVTDSEWDC